MQKAKPIPYKIRRIARGHEDSMDVDQATTHTVAIEPWRRGPQEAFERLLAPDPQAGSIATILSPTEICPSVRMSALIPARWTRSSMIPGLVSCSRCRQGSHSATP